MADSKQVAERLQEFIDAANRVPRPVPVHIAGGDGRQVQVAPEPNPPPSFREPIQVFEDCIAQLAPPDSSELARILDAMFDVLGFL